MKRGYFTPFFLILISILSGCCDKIISQNPSNYEYLKKELSIKDKDFKKIKDNKEIIEELKLSIKDSLTKKKASSILKSFFLEEYPENKLLASLEFNRVFKGKNYTTVDLKDIDSSKALFINNINELEDFMKKVKVKPTVKTTTKISKSDMLRLVEDSINLNKTNLKVVENNDDLLLNLFITIKDSIPTKKIKPQLDALFLNIYSKEEVITNLELYRILKGRNIDISIKRDVDSTKVLNFNSAKELEEFMKKSKVKTTTKIDSTKNE
ncbi:hypothetical protein [uncultured Winogradskyella sp.]|uniref:hypothetical protein n=1 Tax=uncultured Winogradskyella sp. TaxID=395353 RepID=UPI00262CBDC0|nr:hypothetical protein [uncultured Winogradskyella sp.]